MALRAPVDKEEWLYRRGFSSPERKYMNPDGTATSRVFKLRQKDNGELSVDVVSLTTIKKSIADPLKYFLFKLANKIVVEADLQTFHHPLDDGSNEAHAVIVGMEMNDEIMPGYLARNSARVYI